MALKKGRDGPSVRDFQNALAAATDALPPVVVVTGECEYLRGYAVGSYRQAWLERFPHGDTTTIRGSGENRQANATDVAGELSGGSLFSREKLVVVRQGERIFFPARLSDENGPVSSSGRDQAFADRLETPAASMWLLVESAQLPKNRTLGKKLAEKSLVIPCPQPTPREAPLWLSVRARELGTRLSDEAADLLLHAHGADLGTLAAELDKLSLYVGDGGEIDGGAVRNFLTGTVEIDIFGLTNAVEARDPVRAVFYARRIAMQGTRDQKGKREDGERSAHKVMSMLAGTVQGLLRARMARARGMNAAEFAAAEKLSPWRAGKLLDASGRYGLKELRLMARFAADQIRRAHDTGGDAVASLELMAVTFTAQPDASGVRVSGADPGHYRP